MFRDFTLMRELDPGYDFFVEMTDAWSSELEKLENVFELEKMTDPNLVPFELLEKRCVTVRLDFFSAFLGVLPPDVPLPVPQLGSDSDEKVHKALLQIARSCIENNDYIPSFMIPRSA